AGVDDELFAIGEIIDLDAETSLQVDAGPDATVNEGDTFTRTIAFSDSEDGGGDGWSYQIDYGDGTVVNDTTLIRSVELNHLYADGDATPTVSVTVTDEPGESDNDSFTLTVANVAPAIALSGADTVDEGSLYTLNFGALVDPGADTPTAYRIDWGDGTVVDLTPAEYAALAGVATHTYTDGPTDPTITVSVTDEDGSFVAGTKAVTVANVAPGVILDGVASLDEGDTYSLAISGSDPAGAADTLGYTIDWGDGSAVQSVTAAELATLGGSVDHVFTDDEDGPVNATARTISVTVADEDGGSRTETRDVTVNNVAPLIALAGAATGVVDQTYTLGLGAVTDPGDDTVSDYQIDWGDGNTDTVAAAGDVTHTYTATGSFTVRVGLVDEDGTHADAGTLDVTVNAATPTVAIDAGPDAAVNEGDTFTRTLAFSDSEDGGGDGWTYQIDYGDGTVVSDTTLVRSLDLNHLYADGDATHTVSVTVTDEPGESATDSFTLTVANVAPDVVLDGVTSVDEGATYTLAISGSDPAGAADTLGYTIDWGDGSAAQSVTAAELATLGGSIDHVFTDDEDGPVNATARTISVTVADEDGGSRTETRDVTVNNVAPLIALAGAATGLVGQTYTLGLGAVTDPGDDTVSDYLIDWGDGNTDTVAAAGDVTHTYTATGSFTVRVGLVDEDGTHNDAGTLAVAVSPTAEPEVISIGDAPARLTAANRDAWAEAWSHPQIDITHKADGENAAEAWTPVTFQSGSPVSLAGSDVYLGDLGVSGQTAASSPVRQEIDGSEALRFELADDASRATIDLSRFYLQDDGLMFAEAGRVQAFDEQGNLVAEQTFVADSTDGSKQVTLEVASGFHSLVVTAGAYDGTDFVSGGYGTADGGFGFALFTSGGKLHGSEFLIDAVEFEFLPAETVGTNGLFGAGDGF
ncbi:PKD domain-containing protein, partial [Aromatoleum anaerobium]